MMLICLVTADLKDRMIVGIDCVTGFPNFSVVGARQAVPLQDNVVAYNPSLSSH